MPLYEYFCKKCDKSFTITMSIAEHEKKKVKCPECKGTNVAPAIRVVLREDVSKELSFLTARGDRPAVPLAVGKFWFAVVTR